MLRDDSGNGGGRPSAPRNVFGERLDVCSMKPKTGFFRDGCCNTGRAETPAATRSAPSTTAAFLEFSKSCGNDLSAPMPEFGFPGLRPGDRWCLCAPRWREALEVGLRAPRGLAGYSRRRPRLLLAPRSQRFRRRPRLTSSAAAADSVLRNATLVGALSADSVL